MKDKSNYLEIFKGKKITFEVVKFFPDLKIQYVDDNADYKIKISDNPSNSVATLKVKFVKKDPDIKVKKVSLLGDIKVHIVQ